MERPKTTTLVILDGWGIAEAGPGNPLAAADTPTITNLIRNYPTVALRASGPAVGLMWGEQGNSEVGHLTIGAGRVFYQSLPRINMAIESGAFAANEAITSAMDSAVAKGGAVHIVGIVSTGNVHGSLDHIVALLEMAKARKAKRVFVHVILDGRDTSFRAGLGFTKELAAEMHRVGVGEFASISGRYYAMDRDNRWDRTEKAYRAMVGEGPYTADALQAIKDSYGSGTFDEELAPITVASGGKPVGPVRDGDAVVFANFRPERMAQLASAFTSSAFEKFSRKKIDAAFVTMTDYGDGIAAEVAFSPEIIETCLAKVIADTGLSQLHVAETEKFGHVTFFLNGMRHEPFPGEQRIIVPSPQVAAYDAVPRMSAAGITDAVVAAIESGSHDFIVANFANLDMVAHTGKSEPTKEAMEFVDACVKRVVDAALAHDGVVVLTADHGNAEETVKLDTGEIDKEHSAHAVPFVVIGAAYRGKLAPSGEDTGETLTLADLATRQPVGVLADVAPTLLKLMKILAPPQMTGSPLI